MGSSKSGNFKKRKLTGAKLAEIMKLIKEDELSQSAIARAYKVSRGYIWQLAHPNYRPKKSTRQ